VVSSRQGKIGAAVLIAVTAAFLLTAGLIAVGDNAAPAAPAAAAPKAEYVGSEVCLGCHAEQGGRFADTTMGRVLLKAPRTEMEKRGCEACHGPSSGHLADPTDRKAHIIFGPKSLTPVKDQNQACIQCHDKGNHLWWKGSTHEARGLACNRCHKIHSGGEKTTFNAPPVKPPARPRAGSPPKPGPQPAPTAFTEQQLCAQCHPMRKAQSLRSSHMPVREGKMTCSDCHNPHGSTGPSLLTSNSIDENCYRCHAEKRGPFLWEHPPAKESCDNCHEPHGSMHARLLKLKAERLCQRCHVATRHPGTPHAATTRYVFNHTCLNCHSQIHGSNHPSGEFFLR
jgi:predicted CXXCH cytochrome family protein